MRIAGDALLGPDLAAAPARAIRIAGDRIAAIAAIAADAPGAAVGPGGEGARQCRAGAW
ncbi:hypothetical protein QA634_18280 [Methylobacterium sp. CB376]|uniref:hypothetical protein n=1 Tax=Methylobacterium sp. CB376 TaxID=3138063 RepID=UPI0024B070B5|nr:hypothetical protein [Methylobacterium nodulans]WFT77290.1 hypothetical protein QA634_18280 [Methylobacterium nodulans]